MTHTSTRAWNTWSQNLQILTLCSISGPHKHSISTIHQILFYSKKKNPTIIFQALKDSLLRVQRLWALNRGEIARRKPYRNEVVESESRPVRATLCDPMDHTVHGILQARILEWVAIPSSRGSSQPRDRTQVSHITGRFFTSWATGKWWNSHSNPDQGQRQRGWSLTLTRILFVWLCQC